MNKQIWIGLVELRPLPGCKLLEEAKGAYAHVMAWAENPEEFQKMTSLRAADLSLEIIEFRDIQPWSIRHAGDEVREEFYDMEKRIEADVRQVAFGRFHAWFKDELVHKH